MNYTKCPKCGAPIVSSKETGMGYSICLNGHSYDRRMGGWW
jgi:hypothetical protein